MRAAVADNASWVDALVARVSAPTRVNEPLARFTTFRIGGPADVLAEPRTDDEVAEVVAACGQLGIPLTVLGGGSNVLIGDRGVRGCVLRLTGKLGAVVVSQDGRHVSVGAGASFARVTKTCMGLGWPRSNGWVGTPGTVGGAFIMNAGSRQGEVGEVVESIRVLLDGRVKLLTRAECGFSYRHSAFPRGAVLLGGELHCDAADPALSEAIEAEGTVSLMRRKGSQPKEHSAGSIFKNPAGDFAGRLIEAAGLKGHAVGGAQVSPVHANFIVNVGGATAADVVAVADRAQAEVQQKFGVALEWEVRRLGEFA
jgi:UDP-N-acetylmuramate dehydrogenase